MRARIPPDDARVRPEQERGPDCESLTRNEQAMLAAFESPDAHALSDAQSSRHEPHAGVKSLSRGHGARTTGAGRQRLLSVVVLAFVVGAGLLHPGLRDVLRTKAEHAWWAFVRPTGERPALQAFRREQNRRTALLRAAAPPAGTRRTGIASLRVCGRRHPSLRDAVLKDTVVVTSDGYTFVLKGMVPAPALNPESIPQFRLAHDLCVPADLPKGKHVVDTPPPVTFVRKDGPPVRSGRDGDQCSKM